MRTTAVCGALATVMVVAAGEAAAQEMPALVSAYTRQLAEQCGPLPSGASTLALAERVDLNGDGRDDWVVDAGRYPCPSRPALAAAAGAQVTIFKGVEGGVAVPVLQRAAFGSRVQRRPDAAPVVWLTLTGDDCGFSDSSARCDRKVVWLPTEQRFDLAAASPAKPLVK